MSQVETLTISHIGNQGDGLANSANGVVDIPFTLPGEVVKAEISQEKEHLHGKLIEIITHSPSRITPPCPVFGECGGCRLQHMDDAAYRAWKLGAVNHLLEKNKFGILAENIFITPPASRRRVTFAAKKDGKELQFGFHMRESHAVVDIRACPILKPQLSALIEPLRVLLNNILATNQQISIHATMLNGAVEIMFIGTNFDDVQTQQIIRWGAEHQIARIYAKTSDDAESHVLLDQTALIGHYGEQDVALPPAAFMQASDEAEVAMLSYLKPFFKKSKAIADLFCGTGLFALSLYDKTKTVLAIDVDGEAVNALHAATQNLRGFKTLRRNLFREPLKAIELKDCDAICLDPPRAGAKEQIAEIVRTKIKTVAYVSCNPATFMRDARTLCDGGYKLTKVQVFDQFLWSHHIELIGLFSR